MRKLLLAILLLIPASASAAPTAWDFASGVLQPLQSMWTAQIKGSYFTGTSTTATSTFPLLQATTAFRLGADYLTDLTGSGLTITSNALTVDDITPAMLQSADFGDFTCNGTNCSLDADTVAESELDLTAVTLADFTNDAGFLTTVDISANTNLTAGDGITLTNDDLDCDTASGSVFGCLLSADWSIFNNKVSTTSIDTESELETLLTDVSNVFTNNDGALADDNLTNNSIEDLNDVAAMTENFGDLLYWNGSTWTDIATSSLGIVSGGTSAYEIATTSSIAQSQLAYYTQASGRTTIGGVATTSLTASGALSLSQPIVVLGTSASALSITDAVADGTTKGAASFTAADFNSSAGNISIDYTNGQAAGAGAKGFLTSTDWSTFNGKESALTFTYPLVRSTNTISLAFGTTTSNTWAGTQTFTNSPVFTSLTGGLVYSNATSDTVASVSTTTLALSGPFTTTATLGTLVGGANATINWTGLSTTTQPAISNLLVSNGAAGVFGVATTSVTCTGSVTCTTFSAIGASPITINGTGGGGAGSTAWATTTGSGGTILQYPSDTSADLLFGGSSTSTAPFWWDVSASKSYVGQYAANDASITFGPNGTATTSIGIDYSNSEAFSISDSDTLGTSEWFTHLRSGLTGFGSSTPWGILSVASSTYDYLRPMFTVGTTTNSLFGVFSTSTNQRYNGAVSSGVNGAVNGARVVIGNNGPFGWLAGMEQLWINGWWNQRDFQQFCDNPVGATAIAADGIAPCGGFSFMEDGTGTLTASTTPAASGGQAFGAITTAAANDGAGVFLNSTSAGFLTLSTSTPSMEVYARIGNSQTASTTASGNTGYVIGFTNLATAGTAYETAPTAGAFFQATSTNNWQAITRTASASTQTDTGVSSTTALTGSGNFRHFKIVADVDGVDFYIRTTESGPLNKVARHTTNLPTVVLNAGVHMGRVNVGAMYATLDFYRLRVWWKSVLMQ